MDFAPFMPLASAVIAGLIAFFVMKSNNKSTADRENRKLAADTERDQKKLEFDSEQKALDRLMTLRKEVFLPIAGALTEINVAIFNLARAEPDETFKNPMLPLTSALAKLSIIADFPTAIFANKLSAAYGIAYLHASTAAFPVIEARRAFYLINEKLNDAKTALKRLDDSISTAFHSGELDAGAKVRMKKNRADTFAFVQAVAEETDTACKAMNLENLRCYRKVLDLLEPMGELNAEMLVLLRRELGQSAGEAQFREAVLHQSQSTKEQVQQYINAAIAED